MSALFCKLYPPALLHHPLSVCTGLSRLKIEKQKKQNHHLEVSRRHASKRRQAWGWKPSTFRREGQSNRRSLESRWHLWRAARGLVAFSGLSVTWGKKINPYLYKPVLVQIGLFTQFLTPTATKRWNWDSNPPLREFKSHIISTFIIFQFIQHGQKKKKD